MALPSKYVYAIIGFTFIVLAGMGLLAIIDNSDPSLVSADPQYTDFNNSFNKYDQLQNKVDFLSNTTKSEDESGIFGDVGVLGSLILKGWTAITILPDTFVFMTDSISAVSHMFGVPSWATVLVILSITIMIAFAIFAAVFQREL